MTSPIACIDVVELVTDYLDGALPGSLRTALDAHLSRCAGCASYLSQLRTTIWLTGTLGGEDLPDEVAERLLAAFRAWHVVSSGRPVSPPPARRRHADGP